MALLLGAVFPVSELTALKHCIEKMITIFVGHLSNSGDLLLWPWVGVRRCPSCVHIFFSRATGPILTKFGM